MKLIKLIFHWIIVILLGCSFIKYIDLIVTVKNNLYPDAYPASIFKNAGRCKEIKEHLNLMSNKIKKVMSLDSSFLMNENGDNVIVHDFRKKA